MFYWQKEIAITHDKELALNTELPQFSIVDNTTDSCKGTMDAETRKPENFFNNRFVGLIIYWLVDLLND